MNDCNQSKCTTKDLQDAITHIFPVYQFHGKVMAVRHDPAVYESEEDNLDVVLGGKTWKSIDPKFIEINQDDYLLLSGPATAAFLAAWLWKATEDLDAYNPVRDALIFHLARLSGSKDPGGIAWGASLKALNKQQNDLICRLLECTALLAAEEHREEINIALMSIRANASFQCEVERTG